MKGQKRRDKENHKFLQYLKQPNSVELTGLDMVPNVLNKETFIPWLAQSGWVESVVRKSWNKNCTDDYYEIVNEVYLLLYSKIDRLLDIYEHEFLGAMVAYMQMTISIQVASLTSNLHKKLRLNDRESATDFSLYENSKIVEDGEYF